MNATLQRPRRGDGRMIAGVCGGLAQGFGVSTGVVRLAFLIFGLVGAGEIAYIILWLIMPSAPRR